MTTQPWMKFYPTNWRADPALRMCSLAARGLWMEMLCVMHEATPRGDLLINGQPVSDRQLAALAGISADEIASLLTELESAGVFSREDNGTIYSRRMRREAEKSEKGKGFGKLGGNPKLLERDKGQDKGQIENKDKSNANPYMASASSNSSLGKEVEVGGSAREVDYDRLESELREAAGLENDPSPGLLDLSPIIALQNAGYSLNADILPKLRAAKAKGRRPRSWAYFVEAIQDGKQANSSIKPKPESKIVAPVVFVAKDDSRWSPLAEKWREKHGKEPSAMVAGVGGMGWQFPAEWVESVNLEIPERLKRTQAA